MKLSFRIGFAVILFLVLGWAFGLFNNSLPNARQKTLQPQEMEIKAADQNTASAEPAPAQNKIAKSTYIGLWKLEKIQMGQKWKKADNPFTLQLFPNGKLIILMPVPHPTFRIIGTWKILDDGRLQISEEEQNGEPFTKPSISVFTLEKGKFVKPGRPYKSENEKAEFGEIIKKVHK